MASSRWIFLVLQVCWMAGCSEAPAPTEPEPGGVISIRFNPEARQVLEKDTIVYQLHVLTSQPIVSVVLERDSGSRDTLEQAEGLLEFATSLRETAEGAGPQRRIIRVRAGNEEEIASAIVTVTGRERIPVRFFVFDMTEHTQRLVAGEVCYREEGDPMTTCAPIASDGAVNLAFAVGATFDLFYRAEGYTSFRQSVQRQEGVVVYDRPLFAGWNRPMRFNAIDPIVREGDRLTLYAMPDDFPAELFNASVSAGDPEAPVNALLFPIDPAQDRKIIPFSFAAPASDAAPVHPDVALRIREALADMLGLDDGLAITWELEERVDNAGEAEVLQILGDSLVEPPGAVSYDRQFQASSAAAGEPAYLTSLAYTTAATSHPSPDDFDLPAIRIALLRMMLPALAEDAAGLFVEEAGYTALAQDHIAVLYAYFGYSDLFQP